MIAFFKDANLTVRVEEFAPKKFLFPLAGGSKTSSLWLGDPYTAIVQVEAAPGAVTLELDQTQEFPDSGTVVVGGQSLTYTGRTNTELTGIPASGPGSIASVISVGNLAYPDYVYDGAANLRIRVTGADLQSGRVLIRLKRADQSIYGLTGGDALYGFSAVSTGVVNAVRLDLQVDVVSGVQEELQDWWLETTPLEVNEPGRVIDNILVRARGSVFRRDQGLPQRLRLLQVEREIAKSPPSWIVGSHRWRDSSSINAVELISARWDPDVARIGIEKFVAGIGDRGDLELVQLEEVQDSIHPRVRRGHYFTGHRGYYLPANDYELEFLPASAASGLEYTLVKVPRSQTPVFVGNWRLDEQGFYESQDVYRYAGHIFDSLVDDLQFTLHRKNRQLVLNQALSPFTIFVGVTTGNAVEYFDLPVHPVDRVISLYIDNPRIYSSSFVFDREQGTLKFSQISGSVAGQPVYAVCEPAVAVLYEIDGSSDRLVQEVDFNPAFSGVSQGHFYLQHRRQKAALLELSVDKPRISIPPTHSSIIGLVAYGPVKYEGDFALLTVIAYSRIPGEIVPGLRLQVIPGSDFQGLVNYKDPLTETVIVTTGGDGRANLVYTPRTNFGTWLDLAVSVATTSVSGDTLLLPAPVPISQIRNAAEGWLVSTYVVRNDNFLLGFAGGNPALGELPFVETGTPGQPDYRTNGQRELWTVSSAPVVPIEAWDAAGRNYDDPLFDGNAVKLIYPDSLPTGSFVGAYFISYVERVTLRLQATDSNVFSNSILVQMEVPGQIFDDPFLILDDDVNGRLNTYRLGVLPPFATQPNASRF